MELHRIVVSRHRPQRLAPPHSANRPAGAEAAVLRHLRRAGTMPVFLLFMFAFVPGFSAKLQGFRRLLHGLFLLGQTILSKLSMVGALPMGCPEAKASVSKPSPPFQRLEDFR